MVIDQTFANRPPLHPYLRWIYCCSKAKGPGGTSTGVTGAGVTGTNSLAWGQMPSGTWRGAPSWRSSLWCAAYFSATNYLGTLIYTLTARDFASVERYMATYMEPLR